MKLKGALIMLLSCIGIVQAQEMEMMFVGTYTDGGSKGIYSYRFNQQTGKAEVLDSLEMRNPSYLTLSRDDRLIYVVSETHDDQASLNIVRITKNGGMRLIDTAPTEGEDPCYVATNGDIALTANYSGGTMSVFQLTQCGTLAKLAMKCPGATGGPDPARQQAPHVHCACFTPDGKYVLATDFSADRILSFCVKGKNIIDNGIAAYVSADSGPRQWPADGWCSACEFALILVQRYYFFVTIRVFSP